MTPPPAYFDHNATTPLTVAAREAWMAAAERHWHNPSSLYREAGEAKRALEDWREALADHLGVEEVERVLFTSGATEANNAVIRHLAAAVGGTIAISEIEHPSVAAAVEAFFPPERIRGLPVDRDSGVLDLARVHTDGVAAISVMAANNETGVLQPWREVAALCREAGVAFHTDAAQWIGKLPAGDLGEVGYITGSAHKFGGGKGVGFLVLPEEEVGSSFHGFLGGPQEHGRRAGTENLPGVAAMVTALLERNDSNLVSLAECQAPLRDAFEARLVREIGVRPVGQKGPRLWNTSMLLLPQTKNLKWLTRLSQRGFAVSTGSACSAGSGNPSAVMRAMGLEFEEMGRVLRVSGGAETSAEQWTALAEAILEVDRELKAQ